MKYGYYADDEIPQSNNPDYKTNSQGYRCPEFRPLPDGGKNVAVLGCSHTFGVGLEANEIWITRLEKLLNNKTLRFWNLGQPGASPDKCVRILYGCEKVLFPKIIIVCWPSWSRRERLGNHAQSLTGNDPRLKMEDAYTDRANFLKCVFQTEKFAEHTRAVVFHCFAQDVYDIKNARYVLNENSLQNCWPVWDKHGNRTFFYQTSTAKDGMHYGIEHHETFAKLFYNKFQHKLR